MTTCRLMLALAAVPLLLAACLERPETPEASRRVAEPAPAPEPWLDFVLEDGGAGDDTPAAAPAPVPTAEGAEPDFPPAPTAEGAEPDFPYVEVDPSPAAPPAHVDMHPAWRGTSVGWSTSGREVWIAWDEGGGYHVTLHGPVPDDARLVPMLEGEGYSDVEMLLVRPGASEAEVLPQWAGSGQPPYRMWVAPAPGSASEAQALEATVALRYLRTCPGLMETCALYGAPVDVEAAEDPVQPLGGWFLRWEHAELETPAHAEWTPVASYDGESGTSLVVEATRLDETDGDIYADHLHRAWLETRGARVHAFDFVGPRVDEMSQGGVATDGDRLVTWIWRADSVSVSLSEHDASTGRRLGSPATATAEPYFDVECGYVLYNTRPMPVRTPDGGLSVALYWGTDGALLFAPGEERGHFVRTAESETLEPWGDDVPDVLHADPVRDAIDPDELLP